MIAAAHKKIHRGWATSPQPVGEGADMKTLTAIAFAAVLLSFMNRWINECLVLCQGA